MSCVIHTAAGASRRLQLRQARSWLLALRCQAAGEQPQRPPTTDVAPAQLEPCRRSTICVGPAHAERGPPPPIA